MVYDHSVKFHGVWYHPGEDVPCEEKGSATIDHIPSADVPAEGTDGRERSKRGRKKALESIELEV